MLIHGTVPLPRRQLGQSTMIRPISMLIKQLNGRLTRTHEADSPEHGPCWHWEADIPGPIEGAIQDLREILPPPCFVKSGPHPHVVPKKRHIPDDEDEE